MTKQDLVSILGCIALIIAFCLILYWKYITLDKPLHEAREAEIKWLELEYKRIKALKKAGKFDEHEQIRTIVEHTLHASQTNWLW